jgi:hypothetical protein
MTRAAAVPPAPILSAAPLRRANRALMGEAPDGNAEF